MSKEPKLPAMCTGCGACYQVCPKHAIEMKADDKGFLYPHVELKTCVRCEKCEKVCPVVERHVDSILNSPTKMAFAAKASQENIQLNATSGGFFSTLALQIIQKKGVVYGVAYTPEWEIEHIRVEKKEDLSRLAESKYAQSNVKNTYAQAKEDLDADKYVLFSGTSCQIAGLKMFLKKEYEKLLLVDVVCHGVPSPKVWEWYINAIQATFQSKASAVKHRGKDYGGWSWKEQFMRIDLEDGRYVKENIWENSYMKGFLKDIYLRKSCYNCVFKNKEVKRVSDLTIADYWGCEEIEPDFFDGNGVSLVLINSRKGSNIFEHMDDLCKKETNMKKALSHNVAVYHSYEKPYSNAYFWRKFDAVENLEEFSNLVKRCISKDEKRRKNIIFKIKRKLEVWLR